MEYDEHIRVIEVLLEQAGLDSTRAKELDTAIDTLVEDGVPVERAAEMLIIGMANGKTPKQWAQHLVKLRGAVRTEPGKFS